MLKSATGDVGYRTTMERIRRRGPVHQRHLLEHRHIFIEQPYGFKSALEQALSPLPPRGTRC
jgi:hypothetical protein